MDQASPLSFQQPNRPTESSRLWAARQKRPPTALGLPYLHHRATISAHAT